MNKKIYKFSKKIKLLPFNRLPKITGQKLILPFYHSVSENNPVHIKHLYKIRTPEEFENDLDFMLKYYEPIDYKILLNLLNEGKIKNNYFLLSFDDGLREFNDIIAPILLKKGIPAICFLNSNFIDNKELFFRFKAGILIEKLSESVFTNAEKLKIDSWFNKNFPAGKNNRSSLLSIDYNKSYLLDNLSKILEVDFNEYLKKERPYLSSKQIKELIKKGFHFGAHSVDHPQYSDINEKEQILQTKTSLEYITGSLDLNYKLFSFPFSDINISKNFFDVIFNENKPIADLSFGTAGIKKDMVRHNLQRIPMEFDNYSAKDIIYGEYCYYILKSFIGRNTIKRY